MKSTHRDIAIICTFIFLVTTSGIVFNALNRIEANQTEIINNQIEIIENQRSIDQDSFHSNE